MFKQMDIPRKILLLIDNSYIISAVYSEINLGGEVESPTKFCEAKFGPVAALRNTTSRRILAAKGPTKGVVHRI